MQMSDEKMDSRQASKTGWNFTKPITTSEINAGSFQRIADELAAMNRRENEKHWAIVGSRRRIDNLEKASAKYYRKNQKLRLQLKALGAKPCA